MKTSLLSLLVISLFSCSKDDTFQQQEVKSEPAIYQRSTQLNADPSNSFNPMDSVGFIHNSLLDTFAFQVNFDTILIPNFFYTCTSHSRNWGFLSTYLPYSSCDSMINVIWDYALQDDTEGLVKYIATHFSYSQILEEKLLDLFELLNYNIEDVPIENLIDSVKLKENEFALLSTSTYEYSIFMGTASVLRWSSAYWDGVLNNNNHPLYDILVGYLAERDTEFGSHEIVLRGFWKKLWHIVKTVTADAIGLTVGYSIGSALSGGNPAVGGAAGSVMGAGASAAMRDKLD